MLQNYVAELESENCKLKAAAVEASEDYEVLQLMNTSLLSERNVSHFQCKDLEDELKKIRSASATSIAALEAKIKTAKAHTKEVAAAHDKRWSDFEAELTRDLTGLRKLYIRNVQSIRGLCSPMPEGNPLATDYIHWLSVEVTYLPKMFTSVNENFVSATVEGALVMAGEFVDPDALQDAAAVSEADILPA
jgi:hypothetical protein